jgi:hypothetical protein
MILGNDIIFKPYEEELFIILPPPALRSCMVDGVWVHYVLFRTTYLVPRPPRGPNPKPKQPNETTMAKSSSRSIGYLITTIILSLLLSLTTADPTCSATESDFANDPALHTMSFDIGYGPQEMLTYVQPDVSTFYQLPEGQRTAATPRHNGWAAKFVNMSNKPVRLFWWVLYLPVYF